MKKGIVVTVAAGTGAALLKAPTEEAHAATDLAPPVRAFYNTNPNDGNAALVVRRIENGNLINSAALAGRAFIISGVTSVSSVTGVFSMDNRSGPGVEGGSGTGVLAEVL